MEAVIKRKKRKKELYIWIMWTDKMQRIYLNVNLFMPFIPARGSAWSILSLVIFYCKRFTSHCFVTKNKTKKKTISVKLIVKLSSYHLYPHRWCWLWHNMKTKIICNNFSVIIIRRVAAFWHVGIYRLTKECNQLFESSINIEF